MCRHSERGAPALGAPLVEIRWSAALMDAGVDLRHAHLLLDVMNPVVVNRIGLSRSGETENGGGQSTGDHGGKSELLHFDAFFFLCPFGRSVGRFVTP